MTVTAVHPDSESLELHMEIGREEFRKLGDMVTLRTIEVYGSISDRAREMLGQKATMLEGSSVTVSERSRASPGRCKPEMISRLGGAPFAQRTPRRHDVIGTRQALTR